MIIKRELIKRQIAGETVLVPVGKAIYDANGLFVLNEQASFIWDLLPNVETVEEICKAVLQEYDAPEEAVAQDVAEFLHTLQQMGIL